jgi:hypothetical protein
MREFKQSSAGAGLRLHFRQSLELLRLLAVVNSAAANNPWHTQPPDDPKPEGADPKVLRRWKLTFWG